MDFSLYIKEFLVTIVIVIIFFIIILCITGIEYFSLRKKTKQLKRQIKSAIQKLPKEDTAEEQRKEFVKNYHEINAYFKENQSVFSHIWLEFTEQLIEPSSKDPVFQNSIRPEKFFTLDYFLKQKNINLKLVESMPGILLGIGVLGTFFGLSVSLILALPDLLAENKVKTALNDLIGGAGVAFITSLFGLFFSLIFNFISDKNKSILQNQLNKFNSLLEKSLKFITEEHLLTIYLEEARQQAKYLSNMDENIALKIGDVMKSGIDQMGIKIQQTISQNNQNISEEFLNNIANQMTKGMGDFSRNQMENMEKTLSSLQDNIPPLISRLEDSQKQNEIATKTIINKLAESSRDNQNRINESLNHAMQNIKGDFEEITHNLKEGMSQTLLDSSKELKDLLSNTFEKNNMLLKQTEESKKSFQNDIDQTVDKLNAFTNHLNNIILEFSNTAIPKIQSAFETFNETAEQQKQIAGKNERYIQTLDNLSKDLKAMSFSMSEIIEKLPNFIMQINQSNESLKSIWGNYEKRFSQVDESTTKLFENISEGLDLVSKKSAEYIDGLYQQSSQVSNSFATAVEKLQKSISELSDIVNKQLSSIKKEVSSLPEKDDKF